MPQWFAEILELKLVVKRWTIQIWWSEYEHDNNKDDRREKLVGEDIGVDVESRGRDTP
jgi:hypothetical protein